VSKHFDAKVTLTVRERTQFAGAVWKSSKLRDENFTQFSLNDCDYCSWNWLAHRMQKTWGGQSASFVHLPSLSAGHMACPVFLHNYNSLKPTSQERNWNSLAKSDSEPYSSTQIHIRVQLAKLAKAASLQPGFIA